MLKHLSGASLHTQLMVSDPACIVKFKIDK